MLVEELKNTDNSHDLLAIIPAIEHDQKIFSSEIMGKDLLSIAIDTAASEPSIRDILVIGRDLRIVEDLKTDRDCGFFGFYGMPMEVSYSYNMIISTLIGIRGHGEDFLKSIQGREGLVIIDPLCPLLKARHISGAIEVFFSQAHAPHPWHSVISVSLLPNHYHPKKILKISEKGYLDYYDPEGSKIYRRQQLENDNFFYENSGLLIIDPLKLEDENQKNVRCLSYIIHDPMIRIKRRNDLDLILRIRSQYF